VSMQILGLGGFWFFFFIYICGLVWMRVF